MILQFFRKHLRFILENKHSLNTFYLYYKYQIVDEITISPLIRK